MLQSRIERLRELPLPKRKKYLDSLTPAELAYMPYDWGMAARPSQEIPEGDWAYWLINAGRGFGKTRTGAETVRQWIKQGEQYVNLIGATADDARDIMVEGESGILSVCPEGERPEYKKHEAKLVWPNGAVSLIFTADKPERLRGKQHGKVWADELAAWRYLQEAWAQLKFGLRLGEKPQVIITTTPRPLKTLRDIIQDKRTHLTTGSTYENRANLAEGFFGDMIKEYEGTRLGRQELMAEMLDDIPGAMWTRSNIDEHRKSPPAMPDMQRIVVAIDPAVTSGDNADEHGIITAGIGTDGAGYVWADDSERGLSPHEWAKKAVSRYRSEQADMIVAEANQGGEMVEATIKSIDVTVPVTLVRASRGKVTRAEPIAALYEQGRVHHVGALDALEDQMCMFTSDWDRKAQGYSPDRVDALVWAMTELFPGISAGSAAPIRRRKRRTGWAA